MRLTNHEIATILALHRRKRTSLRALAGLFRVSHGCIAYWLKHKKQAQKTPPRLLKRVRVRQAYVKIFMNEESSLTSLALALRAKGIIVSKPTLHRDVKALGYVSRVRPRTCAKDTDFARRLTFVRNMLRSTPLSRSRIVFSDEKIFTTNDNRSLKAWVLPGHRVPPRMWSRWPEGRCQVWACIGVGFRHIVLFPELRNSPDGPVRFGSLLTSTSADACSRCLRA